MSQGRRFIPDATRYAVVDAMEHGSTVREAAEASGVSIGTAVAYWRRVYGNTPWPAQHPIQTPLRYMRATIGRFKVVDFECPHCGGIIHHPLIDTERPSFCPWCGKGVA